MFGQLAAIQAQTLRQDVVACRRFTIMLVVFFLFCLVDNACFAGHLEATNETYRQDPTNLATQSSNKEPAEDKRQETFAPEGLQNPAFPYINSAYIWRAERFLFESAYKSPETVSEQLHDAAITRVFASFASDSLIHRYDNLEELKLSGGPQVDQEVCLSQLGQLLKRAELAQKERNKSKDFEINRLLDTFGRVPAGSLEGYISWLGHYEGCTRLTVSFNESQSGMRYCSCAIRLKDWPDDERMDDFATLTIGVCLPKSCDSLNYKNKLELVQQLAEFNGRQLEMGTWNFTYLYCLPDEQCDLRIWWKNPGTVVAAALILAWLSILAFATIKHELLRAELNSYNNPAYTTLHATNQLGANLDDLKNIEQRKFVENLNSHNSRLKFYKSLSVYHNYKSLLAELGGNDQAKTRPTTTTTTTTTTVASTHEQRPIKPKIVDLKYVDGLKVFCMMQIIIGHYLMGHFLSVENWRDALTGFYQPFISIGPFLGVDPFFTLTGILTTYSMLKRQPAFILSITTPTRWAEFIVRRYSKLLPILVAVVVYTKYFAALIGSGPVWDYATSRESSRRICHHESWLWTLTIGAGFKEAIACVPAAWYMTCDLAFATLTPPIIVCLYRRPQLGKSILILGILFSMIYNYIYFYLIPQVIDTRPMARGQVHSFKSIFTYKGDMYIRPQFRIAPYLIGLWLGFVLHCYERNKVNWLSVQQKKQQDQQQQQQQVEGGNHKGALSNADQNQSDKLESPTDWSYCFAHYGATACFLVTLFLIVIVAIVAPHTHISKPLARAFSALTLATFHSVFSSLMCLYLLLAATGYGFKQVNELLGKRIWKLLARLNLCALCINMEVGNYLANRTTHLEHYDTIFLLSYLTCALLGTYIFAALLHVLVELPARAIVDLCLERIFPKQMKVKRQNNH